MKREVAAGQSKIVFAGNFRGVCPGSTRANEHIVRRIRISFVPGFRTVMLAVPNPDSFRRGWKRPDECSRASKTKIYTGGSKVAGNEKIKVRLRSYEHTLIDAAAEKIVEIAKRNGAEVSGPIPLPTEKQIITILRAVHKYKDSREQFEQRTHKRLIEIRRPSQKCVEALMSIELPAGVDIDLQLN